MLKDPSLAGLRVLVTAGGSGIGLVIARGFAEAGAKVFVCDIDAAALEQARAAVPGLHGCVADVADEASVEAMFEQVDASLGGLDVLVNNAGIATRTARIHELPVADWDRLHAINTRGVFLVTRACLPLMLRTGRGSVINLASVAALVGVSAELPAVAANYSASKGAVVGFTRQAAVEYAADGIRFNAIAPGWHLGTGLGRKSVGAWSPQALEAFLGGIVARTPMRRTGEPAELAGLCVFLASEASSFMTGEIITSDGGWTAW